MPRRSGRAQFGHPALQATTSPVARRPRANGAREIPAMDQPVFTAVSSTTNEVCSEESSVPVNLRVTVDPAKLPRE